MDYTHFEEIIMDPKFTSEYIGNLQSDQCPIGFIPELVNFFGLSFTDMIDYDQCTPHHDRNLWDHTLAFIDAIPQPGEPPYSLTPDEYRLLRVVGFFHDMGKPASMTVNHFKNTIPVPDDHPSARYQVHNPDGTCDVETHSFKGHAALSRIIAQQFVSALSYPPDEAKKILFLVAHHDDFMRIREVNGDTIIRMSDTIAEMQKDATSLNYRISDRDFQLLMLIGKADSIAQGKEIYEFNKTTNTFPPIGSPSDTMQRKLNTYDQIEAHFPEIQIAFLDFHAPKTLPFEKKEQFRQILLAKIKERDAEARALD